jgi:hypothetical protein
MRKEGGVQRWRNCSCNGPQTRHVSACAPPRATATTLQFVPACWLYEVHKTCTRTRTEVAWKYACNRVRYQTLRDEGVYAHLDPTPPTSTLTMTCAKLPVSSLIAYTSSHRREPHAASRSMPAKDSMSVPCFNPSQIEVKVVQL